MDKERQLKDFVRTHIQRLLGFPDDGQIAGYLVQLNSSRDIVAYLEELLGDKLHSREGRAFAGEFLKRRGLELPVEQRPAGGRRGDDDIYETGIPVTREERVEQARRLKGRGMTVKHVKSLKRGRRGGGGGDGGAAGKAEADAAAAAQKPKKNRRECGCFARDHPFYANCTACGRIACEKEGRGECFFCESFVSRSGTRVSDAFVALMSEDTAGPAKGAAGDDEKKTADDGAQGPKSAEEGLRAALKQRDELLARKGQSKGRIIDEQGDYYEMANNKWLDEEERAKAARKAEVDRRRKEEESRGGRALKLTLAFGDEAGAVVEDTTDADLGLAYTEDYRNVGGAGPARGDGAAVAAAPQPGSGHFANSTLSGRAREVYDCLRESLRASREEAERARRGLERRARGPAAAAAPASRVQHEEDDGGDGAAAARRVDFTGLLPADVDDGAGPDDGTCLSMHQPWASLLVLGIKRFEGRKWSTKHRGRLWIAAAAKEPDPETVAEVERQCREDYAGDEVPFPESYPVGALLGCVTLDNCLAQDEFQKRRAKLVRQGRAVEDSESPFLFECSRPRRLVVPIQATGDHKLWRLLPERHAAARHGLVASDLSWDSTLPRQQ